VVCGQTLVGVSASLANKRVAQVRALTLELSGGEAVRLERDVRRLRHSMLGRQQLADERNA